jgi:hypothetical protein
MVVVVVVVKEVSLVYLETVEERQRALFVGEKPRSDHCPISLQAPSHLRPHVPRFSL